jgi:hypothetical protein
MEPLFLQPESYPAKLAPAQHLKDINAFDLSKGEHNGLVIVSARSWDLPRLQEVHSSE